MGAIISLGSTAACCFGSAACAVCSCCPSMCNSSITSRVMYSVMLLLTMVVCCIMLAPGLQDSLASVPFCKSHGNSLASFSEDLDSFGSKIGLGKVGAGMGIGSTSFQVIYRHGPGQWIKRLQQRYIFSKWNRFISQIFFRSRDNRNLKNLNS